VKENLTMDPTESEDYGGFKGDIRVIEICPGVWTYGSESVAERLELESAFGLPEGTNDISAESGRHVENPESRRQ
jgi:hypothetical protein